MGCNCNKNRTPDEVFTFIENSKLSLRANTTVGIGLFVVAAPDIGILEWRVIPVDGLTYDEAMKRGENCESFQWFPKGFSVQHQGQFVSISSIDDLKKANFFCNDSCRGGCPMGCTCFGNDVRCRQNTY